MTQERKARIYVVNGMVQGVGYRFFTERAAARHGIAGWVKNRSDGCVEVYAVGTPAQLGAFRAELERGPRMASVSAVHEEESEIDASHAAGFSIAHDW